MAHSVRRARVVDARVLSPSVRSLSLAVDRGPSEEEGEAAPFAFTAGQWVNLHVPTREGIQKRAYSIASGPRTHPIELAVTHVPEGLVSPALHALEPGTELAIDGPHGFFTREGDAASAPALFVGTGTGLCPLRSMLTELLADPDHPPLALLFGVRREEDILYRAELEAWAARDPRFTLAVTLSRPGPGWSGRTGYVQAHLAALARELGAPHVFVCGLNRMVAEVRALLKSELGYDRKRIHTERYD